MVATASAVNHDRPAAAPPPRRNPARSRAAILSAATAEFSAKGLAGARVDEIARRAGLNKRMLYQYYGNKEGLYLAVLESVYAAFRGAERALRLGDLDPAAAMRKLVTFNAAYCAEHPELISLLSTENLHRARYLKRSREVPALHGALLDMVAEILARGQAAGLFRRDVAALDLYLLIASLGWFFHSNRWTLSTIFRRDLGRPEARAAWRERAADAVLGYLRP